MLDTVPPKLLADLRRRHGEEQRHYHDWTHIEALLAHFEQTLANISNQVAVLYAVLFHDAVYDPKAADNERQSAALLMQTALFLPHASLNLARRMIEATEGHYLPKDLTGTELSDCAHFLDMDLGILGASEERFDIYEAQIRREYAHVESEAFKAGRAKVLRQFVEREELTSLPGEEPLLKRGRVQIWFAHSRL